MSWLRWLLGKPPKDTAPSRINFRGLFDALVEAAESGDARPMLRAAVQSDDLRATMASLDRYRRLNGSTSLYEVRDDDLHTFYTASRLSDLLLLSFQGREREPKPFPAISEREYLGFFRALGFQTFGDRPYSPFYHEIVEVEPSDDQAAGVEIVGQFWPGLTFGDLLFARAGVRVRAHPSKIRREIAETSTLFWAYHRHRRPASDLSHGSGSNSQWLTRFRRDYVDCDLFHFNVDGEVDISGPEPVLIGEEEPEVDLPIEVRRGLLVNRCFVSYAERTPGDEWPWADLLTVRRDDRLVSP